MAAVVKTKGKNKTAAHSIDEQPEENSALDMDSGLTAPLLSQPQERSDTIINVDRVPKLNGPHHYSEDIEDGEVIGIITLEDVFEELLQEEIVDETDEFVDVHKRIGVAAAAAASSMARALPSIRRLTAHKGGHGKPVQTPRKSLDDDSNSPRLQGNASEQLSANKR